MKWLRRLVGMESTPKSVPSPPLPAPPPTRPEKEAVRYAREKGGYTLYQSFDGSGMLVSDLEKHRSVRLELVQAVRPYVVEAVANGWAPRKLAKAIQEAGLLPEEQAEVFAHMEIAIAVNRGQIHEMREAGFKNVEVQDGTESKHCRSVDGKRRSLDWAEKRPIGCEGCVRSFTPGDLAD